MARIRSINIGTQNVRIHPTEVDCLLQVVDSPVGTRFLQLSTFGSDFRESLPKTSQTLQFDEQSAAIMIREMRRCFPQIDRIG
ncbi:hypothetical protein E3O11_00535 [Cryobacterium levicorallinum]|uniref:Uncharacterized protein n=2 Tax=Cryobacterium levicorallinum TaxID=995038 RepID=A0A4R8VV00_9MICO|nr:hypothetical protein E3O11_00535 [Cryobacterium levicorallinum]